MKRAEKIDWVIGTLRTLGAAAGMLLLALCAAPGVLAAEQQTEAEQTAMQMAAQSDSSATLIWGIVLGLAALGVMTADVIQQKRMARRIHKK